MIPQEHVAAYLTANAFALAVLALAFWRRDAARWIGVFVFVSAAVINARTALTHPQVYVDYALLTPSALYQHFIFGWFSRHVQMLVLPIALGQLTIAGLLASHRRALRWSGVAGAITFLLAIAPLGIGSGFPFSLTFGAALILSLAAPARVSRKVQQIVWWSPRVSGVLLSGFLALFALDAFSTGTNAADALRSFAFHLAPAAICLAIVLLAWRWERVGGLIFFTLAVAYGVLADGRVSWMLAISAPLLAEGVLFFVSSMIPRRGDATTRLAVQA